MATHKVVLKPSVEKDLRPLPKSTVARIMKRIAALGDDRFPEQSIKLAGTERLYRIRIGDYRVVSQTGDRSLRSTSSRGLSSSLKNAAASV